MHSPNESTLSKQAGFVCLILYLAVLVEHRLVQTDTDGHTDGHRATAYTALAQRRAVKSIHLSRKASKHKAKVHASNGDIKLGVQ